MPQENMSQETLDDINDLGMSVADYNSLDGEDDSPGEGPKDEATQLNGNAKPEDEKKDDASNLETPVAERIDAPVHWDMDSRERFAKLDDETKKWFLERNNAMEAAHTRRSQELAPFRNVLNQWNDYTTALGTTPQDAFHMLMQTERTLRTGTNAEKLQMIQKLVRDYGIERPADGKIPEVNPEVEQLRQHIQRLESSSQSLVEQTNQQRMQQTWNALSAFKNQRTEDGQLSHPYYGEVIPTITAIIQSDMQQGIQPNLESAYERACQATPHIRQKLDLENQKRIASSKKEAGSSISGTVSSNRNYENQDLTTMLGNLYDSY